MGKRNLNASLNQDLCVKCREANSNENSDEKSSTIIDGNAKGAEYNNPTENRQLR